MNDNWGSWPGMPGYTTGALPPIMKANPMECFQVPEGFACFTHDKASCSAATPPAPPMAPYPPAPPGAFNGPFRGPCSGCRFYQPSAGWMRVGLSPDDMFGDRCYSHYSAIAVMENAVTGEDEFEDEYGASEEGNEAGDAEDATCTLDGLDRWGVDSTGPCCNKKCVEDRNPSDPKVAKWPKTSICRQACASPEHEQHEAAVPSSGRRRRRQLARHRDDYDHSLRWPGNNIPVEDLLGFGPMYMHPTHCYKFPEGCGLRADLNPFMYRLRSDAHPTQDILLRTRFTEPRGLMELLYGAATKLALRSCITWRLFVSSSLGGAVLRRLLAHPKRPDARTPFATQILAFVRRSPP